MTEENDFHEEKIKNVEQITEETIDYVSNMCQSIVCILLKLIKKKKKQDQ